MSQEERKERVTKESEPPKENAENVTPKCTSICKGSLGGLSCSKDDQSNASLITTNLPDKLNAKCPELKYKLKYLSMCGGEKEVMYG